MAGSGGLTAQPLIPGNAFNWIWMVELLVCGILVLFFLFYFNRLFATLVSYGIRAYAWHKFRVYIDIQALQISLLGGRIFFKGVRYHGHNETILVQNGYLTWQYWLHKVKQVDLVRFDKPEPSISGLSNGGAKEKEESLSEELSEPETGGIKEVRNLPCRISLSISGLEWFVYNRSPAYDAIIGDDGQIKADHPTSQGDDQSHASGTDLDESSKGAKLRGTRLHNSKDEVLSSPSDTKLHPSVSHEASYEASKKDVDLGNGSMISQSTEASQLSASPTEANTPLLLRILPVWLECHKGAIVLGNDTTRAILTTTFDNAKGHIDASSSGPRDQFRQIFDFQINQPVVQMRPNPDFIQLQKSAAEKVLFESEPEAPKGKWWSVNFHLRRRQRKVLDSLRNLVPYFRRSVHSFHATSSDGSIGARDAKESAYDTREGPWLGLGRYLGDDEHDDHAGWTNVEYAKFSTVLDCPSVHMNFYWDTPGQVTIETSPANGPLQNEDINGCDPPAYGLDLVIGGGTIDYGPWTDRLRAELQNAFFPNPFKNVNPAQKLKPGTLRQSTVMKINITIEHEVSLRVPTRESSKDWQWKGRADALRGTKGLKKQREKKHFRLKKADTSRLGPDIRPFGWLTFHVDANSTVTYEMDMVPGRSGYHNHLEIDLKGTRASSSVNHALLWRCGQQQISCDLSNPLGWNDLHKWAFSIHSHSMELFLLRDHMFLLTDLIGDFTSGPVADYMTFVPFQYNIKLFFKDTKVYLNTNDANIIDDPCNLEENSFLILGFEKLDGSVDIPMRNFSPVQNSVLFKADGHNVCMELKTPTWNTLRTFVSNHPIAVLKDLALDGSYNYKLSSTSQATDTLFLNISGASPKVYLHGFLIKYFMKMKDNYFGDFIHFRTLEEYQEVSSAGQALGPEHLHSHAKKDDDLDVILNIRADQSCALLPANLYSRKDNVRFDILLVEADMRFTNYYMDLNIKSSPIEGSLESLVSEEVGASGTVSNTQLFVDGISVYGHRLFGAPPSEPTYVCNWDFDVGKVMGECSSVFIRTLAFAGTSFAFTLDDDENTISIANTTVLHDITFLRARVESIGLWFLIDDAAVTLQTGHIDVSFNDWAGAYFSERLHAIIPNIIVAAIDQRDAVRHRGDMDEPVKTFACFETSVDLKLVEQKADFAKGRALQQHHVRFHDQRTHRADWLLLHSDEPGYIRERDRYKGGPPSMPIPHMPQPITEIANSNGELVAGSVQDKYELYPGRKTSFLSLPSSQKSRDHHFGSRRTSNPVSKSPAPKHSNRTPSRANRQGSSGTFPKSKTSYVDPAKETGTLAANFTLSSPWSSPYFPLQKTKLDRAHLPQIASKLEPAFQSNPKRVDHEAFEAPNEGPRTTHASFLIEVRPGLTGFCTPQLFGIVSALVKQLQPAHPVDMLDQVQIDTMSRILKLRKLRSKARLISDFKVNLPFFHLRLINVDDTDQNSLRTHQRDQYDLILAQLGLTFRLFDNAKDQEEECRTERGVLIFTQANEIYVAVSGKSAESPNETASAQISLEDVEFWLGSRPQINAKLQLRSVEAFTWGKQIGYLSSLIHRTGVVAEQIGNDFKVPDQNHKLRHLVYHLTVEGAHLADPVFLTKPSYVLRSAGDHLRQNDSWKCISRLRSMYRSLPRSKCEKIISGVAGQVVEYPKDAEEHVLASFDQWRNWDHGNVQNSFLMERIWGKRMSLPTHLASQHIRGELFVGSIRLLLDPGPKQNECAVKDLDIIASLLRTPNTAVKANPGRSQLSQKITFQGYCARIALNLNWVLVDLIGDTLVQFQDVATDSDNSTPILRSRASEDLPPNTEMQLVFGTDLGSLTFDSTNLTLTFAAEKLRASAIHSDKTQQNETLNLVLSANSALAKLLSNESQILGWKLSLPAIHASQSSKPDMPPRPSDLRVAGICHKLRFDLKEDILKVLSIIHRVIADEVDLIHKLISRLDVGKRPRPRATAQTTSMPLNIRVALFLDDYRLNLRLLPSLTYTISGRVARTSLRPSHDSRLQIDLDLEGHTHSFHTGNGQGQVAVSTLGIPPINGRVLFKRNNSVLSLDADTTLETIRLEAADVRSCFDALTKPETTQAVADAQRSIKEASARVETMFASPSPRLTEDRKALQVFQYTARATFHGLVVHCSAPGLKDGDYRADLQFHLGLATALVHNRTGQPDGIHDRPQFDVHVRRIGLALGRSGRSGMTNVGELLFNAHATGATELDEEGQRIQVYRASSDGLSVDLFAETASLIVDVTAFLQERIKSLVIPDEVKQIRPLRRMTIAGLSEKPVIGPSGGKADISSEDTASSTFLDSTYALELGTIQVRWIVLNTSTASASREQEDLVFSIRKIDLSTKREGSARLAITDLQLQMVPKSLDVRERSANSALLPEVVFNVAHLSTKQDRRFAFQAAGKALDLRLASDFIVPASLLQSSLGSASEELRNAKTLWATTPASSSKGRANILGSKRMASLLVDADFAGAVVNIQARRVEEPRRSVFGILKGNKRSRAGRYGQVVHGEAASEAVLRAPGVAFKVEYRDAGSEDPSLSAEIKVAASSNVLYPSVVPLIIEISSSIKEIVSDSDAAPTTATEPTQTQKYLSDATISSGDPATILGRCKLNIGLWISKQEFTLSCQPIARVAATARFDSIFMTINTVQSPTHQRFFALLINFNKLQASVQHVYSRESTASFDVDSIVMSLMNSKHVTTNAGISALLNISPMTTAINAKQLQDFLLFREIWYPTELRQTSSAPTSGKSKKTADTQAYVVQRYQQVATASAFQWNAVASIEELKVQLDLGQGLGKSLFTISKLWASTKKNSDWEQNLCIGFEKVAMESTGRMSGFIELQNFRVRTSIRWPLMDNTFQQTPLVQASLGFDQLRVKAAFDYQPFAVADISTLEFLMYNVRPTQKGDKDRLVGILDGDKVQVFCTTSTASQSLGLYQAVVRLIEEKETDYEASLRELDRYLRRKSVFPSSTWTENSVNAEDADAAQDAAISLHTDVVVTLRAINAGVFPSTFFDNQILKVEATDAQARFAVSARDDKTHSGLGLTLGQLRVALSNVNRSHTQALGEVSVSEIVSRATSSRGGTILKVPKVVVTMQTWQTALSNHIDYIFKSTFEGKIDVGWNYSRVSFIRGMWSAHARALAHRLGKPLPQSAVQIKGGPQPDDPTGSERGQEKITAVVNVPQSRFEYTALEPPIIDTPQLRDMGEATPPLEWIGLHRDRLPHVTHQIIIVTLLEVAKEVEKAYALTLGYSSA